MTRQLFNPENVWSHTCVPIYIEQLTNLLIVIGLRNINLIKMCYCKPCVIEPFNGVSHL